VSEAPRPSPHPVISGRERELRALADEVRRLVALTVTNAAPADETADVASQLAALADRLALHVPTPPPPRHVGPEVPDAEAGARMPYDVVLGEYNPLALPIEITVSPPLALGHARFTTPYEGPPGCVHGAVIAGAFDMVLNAANQFAGVAGPTARLTIRYRRPTRVHRDLTFEAWVASTKGRRTITAGRILQDGVVTAEAEGLFVALDRDRIMRMGRRDA
jgi:acyl-coenzyme A thioesterase PaaI-like protein